MTGPEHYTEAEKLATKAYSAAGQSLGSATTWAAIAQVHATLALAAATAPSTGGPGRPDAGAWQAAAGQVPPRVIFEE